MLNSVIVIVQVHNDMLMTEELYYYNDKGEISGGTYGGEKGNPRTYRAVS